MTARGRRPAPRFDLKDRFAGEGRWLAVLASTVLAELVWWAACWREGTAPAPLLGPYLALSVAGLISALGLRFVFRRANGHASWAVLGVATVLVAVGASLFLPLKYAIPNEVPFWLDVPLARGERALFGTDGWRIADQLFGWALVPVDRIYGLWLPVQALAMLSVLVLRPSRAKSHALIAYSLGWFLLGVVAAVLSASVGPIFYDRLLGGHTFLALSQRLDGRAWMTVNESNAMWESFASGRPGLVAGISAMPSLHVAISVWIWLAARSLAPRAAPLALAYAAFVWIASIQLGWHYASDGLAGALGMGAIWWLSGRICGFRNR